MASGAPRGYITTGIFSTDKVIAVSKHKISIKNIGRQICWWDRAEYISTYDTQGTLSNNHYTKMQNCANGIEWFD